MRTGREREREAREEESGEGGGEGREEEAVPTFDAVAASREKATDKSGRDANQEKAGRPRKSDGSGGEDPS